MKHEIWCIQLNIRPAMSPSIFPPPTPMKSVSSGRRVLDAHWMAQDDLWVMVLGKLILTW